MPIKKISIDQLTPGMFVTQIDIPWMRSPFLLHHRKIKSDEDVVALRAAGVKIVAIDTTRGHDTNLVPEVVTEPEPAISPQEDAPKPVVALSKEMNVASKLRESVMLAVNQTFEQLRNGETLKTENLLPLVDDTVASLARNDQAMMTLLHMQRKAENLLQHAFGTFSLALGLANHMQLGEDEKRNLGLAALLHDSGWLKLPQNLFAKRQRYTESEAKLVSQHLNLSLAMLKQTPDLPRAVADIIAQHHEHPDGSGYPQGLTRSELSVAGKILATADRYDQLVHGLMDSPGCTATAALQHLYKDAQRGHYDDETTAFLVHLVGVYPIGTAVELDSGEKALVIEHHQEAPQQPTVAIYYDRFGHARLDPIELDLRKQPKNTDERRIKNVVDPRQPGIDPARLLVLQE